MLVYNLYMLILYCVASLVSVFELTTFCVGRLNAAGLSCSNAQQEGWGVVNGRIISLVAAHRAANICEGGSNHWSSFFHRHTMKTVRQPTHSIVLVEHRQTVVPVVWLNILIVARSY